MVHGVDNGNGKKSFFHLTGIKEGLGLGLKAVSALPFKWADSWLSGLTWSSSRDDVPTRRLGEPCRLLFASNLSWASCLMGHCESRPFSLSSSDNLWQNLELLTHSSFRDRLNMEKAESPVTSGPRFRKSGMLDIRFSPLRVV